MHNVDKHFNGDKQISFRFTWTPFFKWFSSGRRWWGWIVNEESLKRKKNWLSCSSNIFCAKICLKWFTYLEKWNIYNVSILVHCTCINIQTHELQKACADKFLDRLLNLKLFYMYLLHNFNEGVKKKLS